MTIETGSAQNSSRPAAAESKQSKGKPGGAHGHGSGGAGGFMAVLASLDTPELAVPGVVDGPGAIALAALQRAAAALKGAGLADADLADGSAGGDPTELEVDKLLNGLADAAAVVPTP